MDHRLLIIAGKCVERRAPFQYEFAFSGMGILVKKDRMIMRLSFLFNVNAYVKKRASLYWDSRQVPYQIQLPGYL